jgi:hypothetical protein
MKDPASIPPPAEQHNQEIHENRRHWNAKPALREVYREFYTLIAANALADVRGSTVELGSGMGNIKQFLPACITTDIFTNPWLDQVENAYALSFSDGSIANLILFDVFHHLEFPGRAFAEATRVTRPGSRLIIFDHDMGWIPRLICRLFHHEPLGFAQALQWDPPADFDPWHSGYHAAIGKAFRCFVRGELQSRWSENWRLKTCLRMASFAWLGSGGFRGPQLYPDLAAPFVRRLDRWFSHLPTAFAARLLVVLERRS